MIFMAVKETEPPAKREGHKVLDKTTDNYLIQYPDGQTDLIKRNPTNRLLYEEDMYDFLHGEKQIQILRQRDEGYIAIAPTQEDDVFTLWFNSPERPIITNKDKAHSVLEGLADALNGDYDGLREIYTSHIEKQVRPSMVNRLLYAFPAEETEHGWRIDDSFLLTWENEIYQSKEDMEEDSLARHGSRVESVDSRELISLRGVAEEIEVEGLQATFTELEVKFLAMALWLVEREERIEDDGLWRMYG